MIILQQEGVSQMKCQFPEVSIVIPVYNTKDYLRICIDSILIQTYPNIKIIVIDDASDDNILDIIENYRNNKIVFHRLNKNQGPGGARNEGLKLATGKYIMFCDSDDWLDIHYVKTSVKYMEKSNADIGMTTLKRNYSDTEQTIYKCKYDDYFKISGDIAIKCVTGQYDMGFTVIPPVTNKIYNLSFLRENNLTFIASTLYEDLLFCIETFTLSTIIIGIPNVIYHHYKRKNSIVQSFSLKHIDDFETIFINIKQFWLNKNLYNIYKHNYYKFLERFYNLVVRQIFEFVSLEEQKKEFLSYSFEKMKNLIIFDEYLEYSTAEQLRQHIQPHIKDTTIY